MEAFSSLKPNPSEMVTRDYEMGCWGLLSRVNGHPTPYIRKRSRGSPFRGIHCVSVNQMLVGVALVYPHTGTMIKLFSIVLLSFAAKLFMLFIDKQLKLSASRKTWFDLKSFKYKHSTIRNSFHCILNNIWEYKDCTVNKPVANSTHGVV